MSVSRGTGGPAPEDRSRNLLMHLLLTVPLRVVEVAKLSWDERIERARGFSEVLASHGDDLMFGGKNCREALRACVDGLAVLSFCPGGVEFLGERFEAERILAGFGLGPDGERKGNEDEGSAEAAG